MGNACGGGAKAPRADDPAQIRREAQVNRRRESQENLRPVDDTAAAQLEKKFAEESNWVSRPPWYKKGKYQQGLNLIIADPEPLRETIATLVMRGTDTYSITIGFSNDTMFDATTKRFGIQCSTVSGKHCRINFSRHKGKSIVEIEDLNSLNGTFVLGRPTIASSKRPMLEREVRNKPMSLEDIEYIRLGSACVLVLDQTNIYYDDDEGDESDSDEEAGEGAIDMVQEYFDSGWYYPTPCHPKLREITQKKRYSSRAEKEAEQQRERKRSSMGTG